MNVIRSHGYEVFTETINKITLSANDDQRITREDDQRITREDDQRITREDKTSTFAHGYHELTQ